VANTRSSAPHHAYRNHAAGHPGQRKHSAIGVADASDTVTLCLSELPTATCAEPPAAEISYPGIGGTPWGHIPSSVRRRRIASPRSMTP
jgi:hypothetical protein